MDEAANDNSGPAPASKRRCPICGRSAAPEFKPFCSKRCADVDLHRWLGGVYAVPDDEPGRSDDEEG